jgi:outer membrane protein OmpA-like peptidoglycan-associated protein
MICKNQTRRTSKCISSVAVALFLLFTAVGIVAQSQTQGIPAASLTTGSSRAVSYIVGGGSVTIDMVGSNLASSASGELKVKIESKAGRTSLELKAKDLNPPSTFGAEFLTYVVWVVTPDGRTGNTGELLINKNGDGTLTATTPAQTFSVIVTAEPYFAVRIPSELVVLNSEPRDKTKRTVPIDDYKLMRRAVYQKMGNPLALTLDPNIPLIVYEARNAVEIAKERGSAQWAPQIFSKATGGLQMTEQQLASKGNKKVLISTATMTVQSAEDARALTVQKLEAKRIADEKAAAAAEAKAQAEAKAAAEAAEAKRIADAKAAAAKRLADEQAAEAKRIADAKAAEAKRIADAEIAAQEKARKLAEEQKAAAILEKQQLRAKLLAQFNRVLPTTDTTRGLVVNMGDVLFDTAKSNLRVDAQLALAKLTGIVLNYPSLKLAIGGYTDSTGSEAFNQTLSEKRADAVRDYLISQGLDQSILTAQGFGMSDPVADNKTAAGRQKNRRVEIVISGEVIGTEIGKGD